MLIAEGSGKTRNEQKVKNAPVLFEDDDYNRFSFLKGNRLGCADGEYEFPEQKSKFDSRVANLSRSMESFGFSKLHPLHIVIIDGVEYILDGQGRYAAAKEQGIKYYFVYVSSIDTIEKAQDYVFNINTSSVNFSGTDKLQMLMYKESTPEEAKKALFKALEETRKRTHGRPGKHTNIAFMNTLVFFFGQGCLKDHKLVAQSYSTIRETAYVAIQVQKIFNDHLNKIKNNNYSETRAFADAISEIANHPLFFDKNNSKVLDKNIDKIVKNLLLFVKSSTQKQYLIQFENVLNGGRRQNDKFELVKKD